MAHSVKEQVMKVLVTGGAGYIGSHAVKMLVEEGHEVMVLDNLSKGHLPAIHKKANYTIGNVADTDLVRALLTENKIEAVMHFAAFIEVGESVTNPDIYYQNNFANALAMLRGMKLAGVKRIVFSSTAAVYGNPFQVPIAETHPLQPINPYGRSKMMTEMAIEDFSSAYGFGYTILRYFNVAGAAPDGTIGEAHEPESHLIPRILAAAQGKTPEVKIFGTDYETPDGTCIRDYIHVEDLARAHVLALEAQKPGLGSVYNLGSEKGFSVREVIDACQKVTGLSIQVEEHGRRPGDPPVLVASSARIRQELGWRRKHADIETIISHAWNWHRSHPNGFQIRMRAGELIAPEATH
jgi:UDP-glucose 4-epimerase